MTGSAKAADAAQPLRRHRQCPAPQRCLVELAGYRQITVCLEPLDCGQGARTGLSVRHADVITGPIQLLRDELRRPGSSARQPQFVHRRWFGVLRAVAGLRAAGLRAVAGAVRFFLGRTGLRAAIGAHDAPRSIER